MERKRGGGEPGGEIILGERSSVSKMIMSYWIDYEIIEAVGKKGGCNVVMRF